MLLRFPHRNILVVYGVCVDGGDDIGMQLVMAYCAGGSLESYFDAIREAGKVLGILASCMQVSARARVGFVVHVLPAIVPLETESLSTIPLTSQMLSFNNAIDILYQAAAGMRHLHRHNIIHRDFRAANILVAGRDPIHVVVADFGVSHQVRL